MNIPHIHDRQATTVPNGPAFALHRVVLYVGIAALLIDQLIR